MPTMGPSVYREVVPPDVCSIDQSPPIPIAAQLFLFKLNRWKTDKQTDNGNFAKVTAAHSMAIY